MFFQISKFQVEGKVKGSDVNLNRENFIKESNLALIFVLTFTSPGITIIKVTCLKLLCTEYTLEKSNEINN